MGAHAEDTDVYYDPYDVGINADPYPTYRRLRDEAPIYHNDRYDVWVLSRHADVEKAFLSWPTLSNSRSDILEIIQSGMKLPDGVMMFEDPPLHTMNRGLMSRVFTPRRMAELEDQVRAYCARCLDQFAGVERFDIVAGLASVMPMRVIGMLLGIPEADQVAVRDRTQAYLRADAGKPLDVREEAIANGDMYADYVEWRAANPSDDLMTALLTAEFEDDTGTTRTLTRDEVLTYTQVLAGAGTETTGRLIGWMAKVLADHPDQRRELVADRSLIPSAVEETLRFEPNGHHMARYVMHDVDHHGTTVPEGSALLLLVGSANRDERRYENAGAFDIHRDNQHLSFGHGLHFCLGAALARLQGRIALDEMVTRFGEWEIDETSAVLGASSTSRGWTSLTVVPR